MKKWKAIARCAIGVGHQKNNLPCQDFGAYSLLYPHIIVGAVADGAGSAKYSDIGAEIAVNKSIDFFQELGQISLEEAEKLFTELIHQVINAIKAEAKKLNCPYQELACTLIVFYATPEWIIAMQIGDGFIVVRPLDEDIQLLFIPDKGEYINETTFVTSNDVFENAQITVKRLKSKFICASTDGLENVAIQYKGWQSFQPFFSPLEEYLKETIDPENNDEYLKKFLNSEQLNSRTNDDKTLLLALLSERGENDECLTVL